MTDSSRYNLCCRLCLTDSVDNPKSIFDENIDDRSLQRKIFQSLGVEILVDDKLSTIVCFQCVEKVNNWQNFKVICNENQLKLEQWMTIPHVDISDGFIHIKDEPIDHDSLVPEIVMNGDATLKNEQLDEEYNELPPPLTPQRDEDDEDVVVVSHNNEEEVDSVDTSITNISNRLNARTCSICNKEFSSSGNRKKHERMIHGVKPTHVVTDSDIGSYSQDDRSQSSIDSTLVLESLTNLNDETSDQNKILFAAGLKLLQTNSVTPISLESLSRIENSYLEKCKAMVTMYNSLVCACHDVTHPNLKGLLSHLRALRIWFPVFTCYHCMITFTDRSSSTRHYLKCPKKDLESLVKLSNMKKRSEVKTRLYQNYKCTLCRFMYSFHDDFCAHVDEDHCDLHLPYRCMCGSVFTSLESYKDHAYISCLVEYYCDICFVTVSTLDGFKRHAAEVHDASEGFILLQDDNYKQRKYSSPSMRAPPARQSVKREYTDESNIVSGKRRSSYKPPILESEDSSESKVVNPMLMQKIPGTVCPICCKEFSSNNNMWRHYKNHFQERKDNGEYDSLYCCPDCGGMFNSAEWAKHKNKHEKKICNECGKEFQFQSELDQHRSVHLNLKLYRDSKTKNYKSTMASPNSEAQGIIMMCEVCDKIFTSKEQLKEHKMSHDSMPILEVVTEPQDEKKKWTCTVCQKQYNGYSGLWDHRKKKHPEIKFQGRQFQNRQPETNSTFTNKCIYCEKSFTTSSAYASHIEMHERNIQQQAIPNLLEEEPMEDDTESYHTCKKCFKVFSTKSNLRNHMRSHGSPVTKSSKKTTKKVWCNICHTAFDNQAGLERHKVESHGRNDNEMPTLANEHEIESKAPVIYTCDICTHTFTSKSGLKKHKYKHAKEQQFGANNKQASVFCKHCKISFATPVQLSNHINNEHGDEYKPYRKKDRIPKNFGCNVCGKAFVSTSALYAHQGWHKRQGTIQPQISIKDEPNMEESPFECSTCKAGFPNDTALQIHVLERHRNVNATVLPARCTMCNLDFGSQDEYERHKQFHAMVEKQPKSRTYGCTKCPAGFSKAEMLKNHVRQFHKEPQMHKCHFCERVFEKSNSLSIHLKVHEKQRLVTGSSKITVPPFNNSLNKAANLLPNTTTIKGSTTIKPVAGNKPLYSCSICSKGFQLPKDLRTHTIQAHPF